MKGGPKSSLRPFLHQALQYLFLKGERGRCFVYSIFPKLSREEGCPGHLSPSPLHIWLKS